MAVRRPLTILMIILMIVIIGYRSYTMMQVERLPKTDLPFVSVFVSYSGASSEDIQDQIVKPLEDAVAGLSGVDSLSSNASEGSGSVSVSFQLGVDGNQAAINVERAVAGVRGRLPADANDPVIQKADMNAQPIITLNLSGPQGQDELAQFAKDNILARFQSVDGVASVNVNGGREHQIQLQVLPSKLIAYGLSLQAVQQAIAANNLTMPAGSLDLGRSTTSVRAVGTFNNLDDVRNLVISNGAASSASSTLLQGQNPGGLVRLKDVANVIDGYAERTSYQRYNGVESVSIGVVKTSDANTIKVADGVRARMAEVTKVLPPGAELNIVNDSAVYTKASVEGVQTDLLLAILITGLVMLVFLHTIRSTFIVIMAIPTSIIATFLVMWVLGFTLNTMTLMALTLVIGILVDDSIVVLENTERHLKMGKSPSQAALDGRAEIGMAAITITLVDVVVYLPVAFTSGIIGQFFKSYGLTIVAATLFSLAISFTLTPMLASQWLRRESDEPAKPRGLGKFFHVLAAPISWMWRGFTRAWEAGFDALANGYASLIRWALRNVLTQSLVVVVAAAALAAGIWMVTSGVVGTEFMPQEDDGQFSVNVTMPASTNLVATDLAVRQVEDLIRANVPELDRMITSVGGRGGSGNSGNMSVYLVDKSQRQRTVLQVVDALRPRLAVVPEARTSATLNSSISLGFGGGGGALQVQMLGPDYDKLVELTAQAEQIVRTVSGVADVINSDAVRSSETQLVVDRSRLSDANLSASQVASGLRMALSGTSVGTYKVSGATDLPIMLRVDPAYRKDVNTLLSLPIAYSGGKRINLGQVVRQVNGQSPTRISRTNRELVMNLRMNPSGRPAGDISNDIEAALKANMVFPTGYHFQFGGGTQQQRSAFEQLGGALVLSIALIYMLLVALYQSWLDPLAIMFALPVGIVGAFGGLLVTHRTLNIISILGVILLTGIVTKNAILIVDFTNSLREQGYERKAALAMAGRLRLRPILMTTFALIFALLPLLFHTGAGSETRAPMAAVVIGGNITSTLLSLVLVPVAYNALNALASGFSRVTRKVSGASVAAPQADAPEPAPSGGE
jgi:hydrophobic/amphiphilic exporter-1 (mainly G- bacteria), HAE1 family